MIKTLQFCKITTQKMVFMLHCREVIFWRWLIIMLTDAFIEESLTEALKALDKHIRANDDVYKRDIENGLSIMLDDLKDIGGIAYINISYLYSNVLNNRTELLVTAYGEDWYVGEVLYEREIQFGDFFNILPSYAENL